MTLSALHTRGQQGASRSQIECKAAGEMSGMYVYSRR